jgi:DNA-binding CsgD family transcriptional regulator
MSNTAKSPIQEQTPAQSLMGECRRHHLTPRECEVVSILATGDTFKGTAARMGLSVDTVEWHAANLRRKLRAKNALHALAILFGYTFIPPPKVLDSGIL